MLFCQLTFVNTYRGKTRILSKKIATREQHSQKLRDIYVTTSDVAQLQPPWYLSDFYIYAPNMSTQFYVNKHCVPNMVKLVT
jgi:hypothetical protein